jgi:galactokinase
MELTKEGQAALDIILKSAKDNKIDIKSGKVRRTSSRFCLGVEHGDYNGTELFGVGTDRFIWLAYKPNGTKKVRLFSANFPGDGVIEYELGNVPEPKSAAIAETWGRFPYGIDYILKREGYELAQGIDCVLYGNIPGGGMSRSASLCNNLILSLFDANSIEVEDKNTIVDLAQAVENDYIGSPCGKLDQTMVLFAREGMATYYNPEDRSIDYVPIGAGATDFRIVVLDTGTDRPGLEKSTYAVRRAECEKLVSILQKANYDISCLADIKDDEFYDKIMSEFGAKYPDLCDRKHGKPVTSKRSVRYSERMALGCATIIKYPARNSKRCATWSERCREFWANGCWAAATRGHPAPWLAPNPSKRSRPRSILPIREAAPISPTNMPSTYAKLLTA